MATASKQTITEKKEVVTVVEETKDIVTLTLSQAEAEVLRVLVGKVSGDHANSPNKYVRRVRRALIDAGVAYEPDHYVSNGIIHFEEYPAKKPEVAVKPNLELRIGARVEFTEDRTGYDRFATARKGDRGTIIGTDENDTFSGHAIVSVALDAGGTAGAYPRRFKVIG